MLVHGTSMRKRACMQESAWKLDHKYFSTRVSGLSRGLTSSRSILLIVPLAYVLLLVTCGLIVATGLVSITIHLRLYYGT